MIKLAAILVVLLIFNLDYFVINAEPIFEYEKPAGSGVELYNNSSKVESKLSSFISDHGFWPIIKNLVKSKKGRKIDSENSRSDLTALNDIRTAFHKIDLGQVLVTTSICTNFIPKFDVSPLNSAIAIVCYA